MKHLSVSVLGLLALGSLASVVVADTLIAKGSSWQYLDNGSDQGSNWTAADFNETGWKTGSAQLGYGDGDERTLLSFGDDLQKKYITSYFRQHFKVANPADYKNLTVNLLRDDGAVVYLNGQLLLSDNMPQGAVTYQTTALNAASETTYYPTIIPATALRTGDNVLAVEVHQTSMTSSDLSFDLELTDSGVVAAQAIKVTRGPYLQMPTANSMTIRWRTDVATNSQVRFGTAPTSLVQLKDDAGITTEHEVTLTGLLADKRYWYAVGNSTVMLSGDATTFFNTSPTSDTEKATRIWVIGDAGTGTAAQLAVYNAYRQYTGSTYTDLWLMLGDNAYDTGTDAEYQSTLFSVYSELLKQTPTLTTIGNHDAVSADSAMQSGPYYDIFTLPKRAEAGGVASGTEAYYSYNYGNIHFVVLDSQETDRAATGTMASWLKADLQNNTADWLIAFWHHPPYSKGSHDSDTSAELTDMRENFLPILEDHGVDLVLTGHSHSYERSKFIDGHYGRSSTFNDSVHVKQVGSGRTDESGAYKKSDIGIGHAGAVYAVTGSAGHIGGGALNHPAMLVSFNELGSMVLDINNFTLNAKFINDKGEEHDHFTISKQAKKPITSTTVSLQNGLNGYAGSSDSYVVSKPATSNFGSALGLIANGNDVTNGKMIALVQWQNLAIPSAAVLDGAAVDFTVFNASTGSYFLYALNKQWSENTVTWNALNPVSNLGSMIGTLTPSVVGVRQVKLTASGVALVQGWVDGSVVNNGLALVDVSTNDALAFRSSEYTIVNQRPKLTVTYH